LVKNNTLMRNDLILAHLPLCRTVAKSVTWGSIPHRLWDLEDAISCAKIGLVRAADRWDPARGPFAPYARRRMIGAVQDGLRDWDHLSRWNRRRVQSLDLPDPQVTLPCLDGFPAPNGHDPIREALGSATWDFAKQHLKPSHYETLILTMREGWRDSELARSRHVTQPAVLIQKKRALANLRRKLGVTP
jgi:RNA polymerase sigma factor (sigma-70 family)